MPDIIINNTPINYPDPGTPPGWGEQASLFVSEVAEVLNELLGPNDIAETSFNVANNVSSPTNVLNLAFNTGAVRSATIEYSIYRITSTSTYGNAEAGTIRIVYDNSAPVNQKWTIGVFNKVGNAGVMFSILDNGQVQYTSTNITGSGYSGTLRFRAKTISQ